MADNVRVLASKVVNGSVANVQFQGHVLGNLAAGSSASQLELLIDKHFFGMDHPANLIPTTNDSAARYITYGYASGGLFGTDGAPSLTDIHQGALGDCYFLASLGAVVAQSPSAIGNMFADNGDGTFTVRFFAETNGKVGSADYVTVDRWLPIDVSTVQSSGMQFADYDFLNEGLWVALAEKAYVQFSEEGLNQRQSSAYSSYVPNNYGSIEGGFGVLTMPSITGHNGEIYANSSDYAAVGSYGGGLPNLAQIASGLANGLTLTAGTHGTSDAHIDELTGIVQRHEYVIVGADLAKGTVTLYNPWRDNNSSIGSVSTGDVQGFKVISYSTLVRYDLAEISVSYV